jgi:hypothetical protein
MAFVSDYSASVTRSDYSVSLFCVVSNVTCVVTSPRSSAPEYLWAPLCLDARILISWPLARVQYDYSHFRPIMNRICTERTNQLHDQPSSSYKVMDITGIASFSNVPLKNFVQNSPLPGPLSRTDPHSLSSDCDGRLSEFMCVRWYVSC